MYNKHILNRLQGIQTMLMGGYDSGTSLSSASKGNERENFINNFLKEVFPPIYRFGNGDVVDTMGNTSGQLDVVIEHPLLPTLPGVASLTRLYPAESVASVIEIKSNIATQWKQVIKTSKKLDTIHRRLGDHKTRFLGGSTFRSDRAGNITIEGGTISSNQWKTPLFMGDDNNFINGIPINPFKIPLFAIGYTGWNDIDTLKSKMTEANLSGILVIKNGLFVGSNIEGVFTATGIASLWGLICSIHDSITRLQSIDLNPLSYIDFEN